MSLRPGVASPRGVIVGSSSPSAQPATTGGLLLRARRGDSSALSGLAQTWLPRLRRWARGRLPRWARGAADTSDLVQDAIIATLARLDVFQPRTRQALASYLKTAVRNRIRDEHRRAARWKCCEATDALPSCERTPLDRAIDAETRQRYLGALRTLPARDRDLVVAHLELGYSHAQLACMIGRSPNAARMALTRALVRLAQRMADR